MESNPAVRDNQIRDSFKITQEKLEYGTKIDCMFSGTTAIMVLVHNNTLICANSGDSRAILSS
jgi:serine/threonine protein phosphatase PrpC